MQSVLVAASIACALNHIQTHPATSKSVLGTAKEIPIASTQKPNDLAMAALPFAATTAKETAIRFGHGLIVKACIQLIAKETGALLPSRAR